MKRPIIFASILLLSGCLNSVQYVPEGHPLITAPGKVAVNIAERQQFLANHQDSDLRCRQTESKIPVFKTLQAPSGYGLDERYNSVSAAFRNSGSACLGGNLNACRMIQKGVLDWAAAAQDFKPRGGKHDGTLWNDTLTMNMRVIAPAATALAIAEEISPMAATERATADNWLQTMVDRFEHGMRHEGNYKGGSAGTIARRAAHNHAAQSSIAAMSYGALTGNEDYFHSGLEQWTITLDSMRTDGSLPIETRRGARALFYHGRTISALIQLAERAEVQGIDLYAIPPEGHGSIHHAVKFFIDAAIDPELVLPYAKTNKSPGPSKNYKYQDLGGGFGTGSLGWIAPYIARFPDHENTKRLFQLTGKESYLTPQLTSALNRNGLSVEWIGVDAKCFYAVPLPKA